MIALAAALELVLLQSLVDTEVWLRLGGHGIDQHVLAVVVGLAVAGILATGVVAAAVAHAEIVAARLRAVLVLAGRDGTRSARAGRRRCRSADVSAPIGAVPRPVGARGPRAPGSVVRRPSWRLLTTR
ncbi:hypothetical protein [Curtobacterium sp. Leaf261]|uniref:hypothetical protein n=1 Tax=Curtobacterium sp. Leaf261 TaxID=1736311 RepID=UPI000700EB6B|nr:hypothetical protein [Curtobacterium sp. Leaf261]KQO65146.1 hypothetical protein ASF23_03225 [Curtobacterium sp. Leaf261]